MPVHLVRHPQNQGLGRAIQTGLTEARKFGGIVVTMDAEQGVEAMRIIDPRTAVPIHYNDYEAFKSPLEDFKHAVVEAGLEDRVHYLAHGDTYEFEVPDVGS